MAAHEIVAVARLAERDPEGARAADNDVAMRRRNHALLGAGGQRNQRARCAALKAELAGMDRLD